jgi:hypothetical protein
MRKIRSAAVVAAMLGSVGFIGAGTAFAGGHDSGLDISQVNACRSHDANVDVLGNVGVLNGLAGNAVNGEGNPGAQNTSQGSTVLCANSVG